MTNALILNIIKNYFFEACSTLKHIYQTIKMISLNKATVYISNQFFFLILKRMENYFGLNVIFHFNNEKSIQILAFLNS
jgi:hypothetical protein